MDRPVRSMHMDIVDRSSLGGNLYRVTIAANEKVRQPPEIDFAGMSTDNYSRNPVVMWAHDAVGRSPSGGLPIGRTLSLAKTQEGKVVVDFEFLSDDPFAQRVKNAWDKGFLRAASISWLPLETVPTPQGSWRDTRSDLLEWSIVSLPADPDALKESHRRMMNAFLNGSKGAAETRDGPASGDEELDEVGLLGPVDYRDLKVALSLLTKVAGQADQTRLAEGDGHTSAGGDLDIDSEMREIEGMIGEIKAALRRLEPP